MRDIYSFYSENKRFNQTDNIGSAELVITKNGKEIYREQVLKKGEPWQSRRDIAFDHAKVCQDRGHEIIAKYVAEDYKEERSEIIAEFAEKFPQFEKNREAIIMEMIADKVIQLMRERS